MNQSILIIIIMSMMRLTVPIIIAALGNMYCLQAGIMNLGADGMMIAGAFGAALTTYFTGNVWLGVLVGVLAGGIIGSLHSLICVEFGGMQNVSGLGLNILAAGITTFLCRAVFNSNMTPSVENMFTTPALAGVPVVGDLLMQFSPIFYIMIVLSFISWYVMAKTVTGLRIVAVGSDPRTTETAGINVWRLKHVCVITCGLMTGLAGAYLSLGQLDRFVEGMTSGKGMLAIIAVTIGRRKPLKTVAAALVFGFFDALQLQIQVKSGLNLPPELILSIPYVIAVLALLFGSSKSMDKVNLNPYVKSKYEF